VLSCGGHTARSTDNPPTTDGGAEGAAGIGCPADAPPGALFTFRLKNTGTSVITLFLGCGKDPPITLHTPNGDHRIGPESAERCGFTCTETFMGGVQPGGCTDCGPGYVQMIDPGATREITWDRRMWVPGPIEQACSEQLKGSACAMGVLVTAPAINGTIEYCAAVEFSPSCPAPKKADFIANLDVGSVDVSLP
jgi:hypothetical protein